MFLKKLVVLLIIVLPVLIFESCSETPTNVGSDLLDQDKINVKTVDSAIDTIGITSSYSKKTLSLGTSSRIFLGKKGNVEAGILIRFLFSFADTLSSQILSDSIFVENSWMELVQNYVYGNETDPLEFNAYKINSSWTTVGFNADSVSSLQYDNIDQSTGNTISDSLTKITLQPQLVLSWLKASADTAVTDDYGIYIKPGVNSGKILGYYALGSSQEYIPKLYVAFRKMNGDLDTLSYSAYADLSYVAGDLPVVNSSNIVVQAGLEVLSKLNFDVTPIPGNAIINKAELTLTIDTTETVTGNNYTNSLLAYFGVDTLSIDSLNSYVVLSRIDNKFTGDITFFVQDWVRNKNNAGLMLVAGGRFGGVELFALKGANADAAVKPRIIITFTTKL